MKHIFILAILCSTLAAQPAQPETAVQAALQHLEILSKESPRQVTFNLASVGGTRNQKVVATVYGPLTHKDLVTILRVLPLIERANSIKGPWRLSVVGDQRFAEVIVTPLPTCQGESVSGNDWVLSATNRVWSVVAELPTLDIVCNPVTPLSGYPITETPGTKSTK